MIIIIAQYNIYFLILLIYSAMMPTRHAVSNAELNYMYVCRNSFTSFFFSPQTLTVISDI